MAFVCKGCLKTFSNEHHLEQHQLTVKDKPLCRKAGAEEQARKLRINQGAPRRMRPFQRIPSSPKSPSSANTPVQPNDKDSDLTRHFEGDFFGAVEDYHEGDFPGFNNSPQDREKDGYSDDEEEGDEEGLEKTWEPCRPETQVSPDAMDVDVPEPSTIQSNPLLRHLPSERDGICILRFEGRAGETLRGSTSQFTYNSRNGFSHYQSKILGADENIWAPFTSRMDWEVARWAKTRGTGSTAFSDLLAIEGVGDFF
jgi:hypothetical protein